MKEVTGRRRARWRRGLSTKKVGNGEGRGATGVAASRGGASSPVDGGGFSESLQNRTTKR
jgi:hypothetical protein